MQRRHLLLLGLIACVGGRSAQAEAPPAAYELKALVGPGGKTVSLRDTASGRRLLVVVMKSAYCPVCIAQLRRLEQLGAEFQRFGVTLVGLCHDSAEDCSRARRGARLASVLLSDPRQKVLRALGLWREDFGHPMPALLVFDRCGAERGRLVGRRPGERQEPQVRELLEALEQNPERCGRPNA